MPYRPRTSLSTGNVENNTGPLHKKKGKEIKSTTKIKRRKYHSSRKEKKNKTMMMTMKCSMSMSTLLFVTMTYSYVYGFVFEPVVVHKHNHHDKEVGTASTTTTTTTTRPKPKQLPPQPAPTDVTELIDQLSDQRFAINIEIGKEDDVAASRLAVSGMLFDLFNVEADVNDSFHDDDDDDEDHNEEDHDDVVVGIVPVPMPGTDGPQPKLSSGVKKLEFARNGRFVSREGTENVQPEQGCWEVIKRNDAPAGVLICGFNISQNYKGNDAILPKGRIYMSFPLWTSKALKAARKGKKKGKRKERRIQRRAVESLSEEQDDDDDEEEVSTTTTVTKNNVLMKALQYRNAYLGTDNHWLHVPGDEDVFPLSRGIYITTKGLIWSKELPRSERVLLGTASLIPMTRQPW